MGIFVYPSEPDYQIDQGGQDKVDVRAIEIQDLLEQLLLEIRKFNLVTKEVKDAD